MKNTMLIFLKYFLIVASVILAILLVIGFVFMMNWPWWVGICLVLCLVALFIGALFVKKLMMRRKEQQFVQQVIEQDNAQLNKLTMEEQNQLKELQDKWKEAQVAQVAL